jgi:hypothetical protein
MTGFNLVITVSVFFFIDVKFCGLMINTIFRVFNFVKNTLFTKNECLAI